MAGGGSCVIIQASCQQTRQVPVLALCELGYYDLGIWNLRPETDTDVGDTEAVKATLASVLQQRP